MIDFVQDDDRLRDERKKAKKNKDKYVGMSSDAMGFRGSRGSGFGSSFDSGGSSSGGGGGSSGWRDKFQSSGPSGFRDQQSDEEGNSRGPSPDNDVNEFRDEDNDNNYSPAPSQPNSFSGTNKFSDSTTTTAKATTNSSRPTSTSSSSAARNQQQSKTTSTARPKKTIDLGAAATYAAKQKPGTFSSPSKKQTPNNINLFDATR